MSPLVEEHRIDVGDLSLQVRAEGAGAPVLLLHGFTGSIESLDGVAAGLRDQYRVIRADLPGHGRSDAPREVIPYTMPRCVVQLTRLLDALRVERVHLLGYSMGGRVALALGVVHPERVESAILIGTRAGFADAAERAARVRVDEQLARRIESEGVESFVDHWMALPLFASQKRLGPSALREARMQRLANRAHGLAGSLRGLGAGAQPPLHAALPNLAAPVLLVVGEEDLRFHHVARDLAARLPRARLAVVPEAGHAVHLENPSAFLRVARVHLADPFAPDAFDFRKEIRA